MKSARRKNRDRLLGNRNISEGLAKEPQKEWPKAGDPRRAWCYGGLRRTRKDKTVAGGD